MYLIRTGRILSEKVDWVDLPSQLPHSKCTCPDLVLEPQRVSLQVAELPQAGPGGDAQRSAGVRPDAQWHVEAQVLEQTLMPQAGA